MQNNRGRRTPGCVIYFALSFGAIVGGGFVYKWFTDESFAQSVGMVFLILFGVALGLIGVVAAIISNRQIITAFRINLGPGATHYKFDVHQPHPGYPGYSPMGGGYPVQQLPPGQQMTIYPTMPEMPEMPARRTGDDDDDNYSPVA